MTKLLTTDQWLTDSISKHQLDIAYETKDPAIISKQEGYYKDLDVVDDNVVFDRFIKDPIRNQWKTGMTSFGRKFKLGPPLYVNTGKLLNMVKPFANVINSDKDVPNVTKQGCYVSQSNNFIYLIVNKGTSVEEALKYTGCDFKTNQYRFNQKNNFIDVDTPVVAGRMSLVYIEEKEKQEEVVEKNKK